MRFFANKVFFGSPYVALVPLAESLRYSGSFVVPEKEKRVSNISITVDTELVDPPSPSPQLETRAQK